MQPIQDLSLLLLVSLEDIWIKTAAIVPVIVGALFLLIFGWIVAVLVGAIVSKFINTLKVDEVIKKLDLTKGLEKAKIKFSAADLLGALTRWFIMFVFVVAAAEIANLPQVAEFLNKVLEYLPNVIVAVIILLIGIWLANIVQSAISHSVKVTGIVKPESLAALTKWAILAFTFMAVLVQLKVAASLVQTIFTGAVAMIAIAGGIAFGLGGRDHANRLLDKVETELGGKRNEPQQ